MTAWLPRVEGCFVPVVHSKCPHNEITAISLRSLSAVPEQTSMPLPAHTVRVWHSLTRFVRKYQDGAWSHRRTAESYSGALGRRYGEAATSLEVDGPSGFADYYLRAFLKVEKSRVPFKMAKPRLIYPRSPRYNLELASRLKPFEHWLWGRLNGKLFRCGDGSRVVAKGLNARQRANLIVRKFRAIEDCVCVEVDGKSFESHVGVPQLKREFGVYKAAFPGDKRLSWLLSKQLKLEGTLECGARFSREGGRASGDFNTGMGNSLIFLVECVSAARQLGIHYDILVDGDNAVLFCSSRDYPLLRDHFAENVVNSSGHEVSVDSVATCIEEIRFGGSAPVNLGALGWTMVRDWVRVLSGAFSSHIHLRHPKFAKEWMTGVAMCELSCSKGVPILQKWALSAIDALGHTGKIRPDFYRDFYARGAWLAGRDYQATVTDVARLSFERAFGVNPEQQLQIENSFESSLKDLGHYAADFSFYDPETFEEYLTFDELHLDWRRARE
ncbi:RNA-dependent RNA polymerase [Colletotrichum higginsianum ssRNA virus 1]|nr:RNA-dependent RNA polymerase [Colletotrichum higginsianum ssRNA virus 1]